MQNQIGTVFVSSTREVLPKPAQAGYEHSLSYAAGRFGNAIGNAGFAVSLIADPAAYTLPQAVNALAEANQGDARAAGRMAKSTALGQDSLSHVCVREWNDMRLMPGVALNIAHFSWEGPSFPEAAQSVFGAGPLPTLRRFDTVLACSQFLADSLANNDVESPIFVPTPIATVQEAALCSTRSPREALIRELAKNGSAVFCPYYHYDPTFPGNDWDARHLRLDGNPLSRLLGLLSSKSELLDGGPALFVSQGNPGDGRKNLVTTMEGFGLYAADVSDAYLIVLAPPMSRQKLTDSMGPEAGERFGWGWWGSRNVFILPMHLSNQSQLALYGLADFFLNASRAEGQHVPLQEAIQAGCIPVSTRHTAMNEYLDEDASVVIRSEPKPRTLRDPSSGLTYTQEWWETDPIDIASACDAASKIALGSRPDRRKTSQSRLNSYTHPAVSELLSTIIQGGPR